jgi:hypothetical protein
MIIVDKNLRTPRVIKAISTWYRGKVIPVISCPVGTTLRPNTIVKDDAIPALLQGANRPTFVTINVTDFWGRVPPHAGYCIIAIVLPQERAREVPDWLRGLFALPEFKTKAVTLRGYRETNDKAPPHPLAPSPQVRGGIRTIN